MAIKTALSGSGSWAMPFSPADNIDAEHIFIFLKGISEVRFGKQEAVAAIKVSPCMYACWKECDYIACSAARRLYRSKRGDGFVIPLTNQSHQDDVAFAATLAPQ